MAHKNQPRLLFTALVAMLSLLVCACRREAPAELEINEDYSSAHITCDNLYQGDSVEEAVLFMNLPEERRQQMAQTLERYGPLACAEELKFANRVFRVGRSKRASDYLALLSAKMLQLIRKNNNVMVLWSRLDGIQKGHYLYAQCEDAHHGPCPAAFAVTFREVPPEVLDTEGRRLYWPQAPTHVFRFFHFHTPNYMIIGSTVYVVREDNSFKIVSESVKGGSQRTASISPGVEPVVASGIEACRKVKNEEDTWRWNIAISSEDKRANSFEIVLASTTVSADPNASSTSENVLYDYDAFRKYCRAWEDVRFRFSASLQADKNQVFYVCHLGSGSRSTTDRYPGKDITDLNINETGLFTQGSLDLFSFETVDANNIRIKNKVLVRLRPKPAAD